MQDLSLLKKTERLYRCLDRVIDEYNSNEINLSTNYTVQDAIVLNILRACEQCIDIAQILINKRKLVRPATNRELFAILEQANIIDEELSQKLQSMVGFRNIAVHQYETIDLKVVWAIVTSELKHLRAFGVIALEA